MSNASDNKSDVQQAANTANADKIEKTYNKIMIQKSLKT